MAPPRDACTVVLTCMHDATHDDRDRPRALERARSALGATTMRATVEQALRRAADEAGLEAERLADPSATSCGASRSPRARTVAAAGPRSPPRHVASHGDPGSPDRGDRAPPRARGRARRPRLRADRRGSPAGRPPSSRRLIGRRNEALPLRDQRDSVRAGLVAISAARRTAGRPRCPSSDVAPAGGRPAPPSRHPPQPPAACPPSPAALPACPPPGRSPSPSAPAPRRSEAHTSRARRSAPGCIPPVGARCVSTWPWAPLCVVRLDSAAPLVGAFAVVRWRCGCPLSRARD